MVLKLHKKSTKKACDEGMRRSFSAIFCETFLHVMYLL